MAPSREPGRTRDAGFQIGVRRTLPIDAAAAWDLVTSPRGVRAWLGTGRGLQWKPGATYLLADGAMGQVRAVEPGSHVRLTWEPEGWSRPSTIQVRVIPKHDRATVAFHQEHLPSARERESRRAHFRAALDALEEMIP